MAATKKKATTTKKKKGKANLPPAFLANIEKMKAKSKKNKTASSSKSKSGTAKSGAVKPKFGSPAFRAKYGTGKKKKK